MEFGFNGVSHISKRSVSLVLRWVTFII